MEIKLAGEIMKSFQLIKSIQQEIVSLSQTKSELEDEIWKGLRDLFPDKNFTSARIDHEKSVLILPFSNSKNS